MFPAHKTTGGFLSQLIGESCQKISVGCPKFVTIRPRVCNNTAIYVHHRTVRVAGSQLHVPCRHPPW
jgi:hypothetical protein